MRMEGHYMDIAEKECLIELIKNAKGNLTLDDFAERTGISKFQLSRILNGKFKVMPRKSTLSVIAKHSVDDFAKEVFDYYLADRFVISDDGTSKIVSCDSLTTAVKNIKDEKFQNALRKIVRACKGILFNDLSALPFDWTVKYTKNNPSISTSLQPILEIETGGNGGIDKWIFYFEPDEQKYENGFFFTFLGSIMCKNIPPNTKISLIVSGLELYKQVTALPPPDLNFSFSIISVDYETQIVDSEHIYSFPPGVTFKEYDKICIAEGTVFPKKLLPEDLQ